MTELLPYITKGEALELNDFARMGNSEGLERALKEIRRKVLSRKIKGEARAVELSRAIAIIEGFKP